jgi:uncharacterized protein YqjF (DUF2071 family)
MFMRWHELLFMHWPVPVNELRSLVPAGLEVDTFDGSAWVGVVPFSMSHVRPRYVPPVPGLSAFHELNVRTYVTCQGKPGVWFFSLDAASALAVRGARWSFHLPYFDAEMKLKKSGERVDYYSHRTHRDAAPADFVANYAPTAEAFRAAKVSLEDFLTARFCLYAFVEPSQLYCGEIAHRPWPLQPAEARVSKNTMAEAAGIRLPDISPLLHYARVMDVVAWTPDRL